jgi:hypothetical protein
MMTMMAMPVKNKERGPMCVVVVGSGARRLIVIARV